VWVSVSVEVDVSTRVCVGSRVAVSGCVTESVLDFDASSVRVIVGCGDRVAVRVSEGVNDGVGGTGSSDCVEDTVTVCVGTETVTESMRDSVPVNDSDSGRVNVSDGVTVRWQETPANPLSHTQ
jgi:hypothetical protein